MQESSIHLLMLKKTTNHTENQFLPCQLPENSIQTSSGKGIAPAASVGSEVPPLLTVTNT